jgi:hypothetical protein
MKKTKIFQTLCLIRNSVMNYFQSTKHIITSSSPLDEIHPLSPESGLMIDVYGNPIQI